MPIGDLDEVAIAIIRVFCTFSFGARAIVRCGDDEYGARRSRLRMGVAGTNIVRRFEFFDVYAKSHVSIIFENIDTVCRDLSTD